MRQERHLANELGCCKSIGVGVARVPISTEGYILAGSFATYRSHGEIGYLKGVDKGYEGGSPAKGM